MMDVNDEMDPYAYLDKNGFTSEKFKIKVSGLPKHCGLKEFKKLLTKLDLDAVKVKPQSTKEGDWFFVCFKNEEGRELGISKLNDLSWKNAKLSAHPAKPNPDPLIKRKLEQRENEGKKLKTESSDLPPEEQIKNITTPLWNMPYEDQLELKEKTVKNVLKKIGYEILKTNRNLSFWLEQQKKLFDGLPCELKPILHVDEINGYRNKCEFSVGKSVDGKETLVGFRLSSYAAGSTSIGPVEKVDHIPEKMKIAAKEVENFIRASGLEPYNPVDHNGYWRQVVVRTSSLGHLMIILGFNPQKMTPESLDELRIKMKEFFEQGDGAKIGVTSLYYELMGEKTKEPTGQTLVHVSGTEYIEETLLGNKFRISPQAFFQVNTPAAEILYQTAIDLAEPTQDTAVLDVCCGTGTIGLCFSKSCGQVLGMEIISSAIKDAKENAVMNNVKNAEFYVGKAEDVIVPLMSRVTKSEVIAVVDPPRAGLQRNALLALRNEKKVKKIVYLSCDPNGAFSNLVALARANSKQYYGEPFVPVKVIPVDMFPHTKHYELAILLERLPPSEKQ